MTDRNFHILITDRNPHVRDLLKREFANQAYRVDTAGEGAEILRLAGTTPLPHLIILDPETPSDLGEGLVSALARVGSSIPIILHGFGLEEVETTEKMVAARVEKNGDTVRLLEAAERVLRQHYPARFKTAETEGNGEIR